MTNFSLKYPWAFRVKVRTPILLVYAGFCTVYYKDIGEFQTLYLEDICWYHWCLSTSDFHYSIAVSIIQ
jgi:hypothetical protein